jgi:short subunit dehydrogenase-like uncharacterized protein
MSRLNIIIFGATGYTGTFVVRELAKLASKNNLTWGVAGRSQAKLSQVLKNVSSESGLYFIGVLNINSKVTITKYLSKGIDLTNVECIIADTSNEESLRSMCQRAYLIINCVGPVIKVELVKIKMQC